MGTSRRTALMVGFVAILGFSSPAAALDLTSWFMGGDAICSKSCIVPGAEVDDAATIAARARTGTGPAVGIASDKRMKSDITQVGTLDNGIKIYSFKFIWEDKVRVGVIAQDLLERADTKDAVLIMANGLLGVDYSALGLRMATEAQWQQAGMAAIKSDYKPVVARFAKADEPVRLYNRRPGS